MRVGRQQSGIALITVLLILALATIAAVSMTSRQQLDIRRTTNILLIEQAYMALLAAEESAKRLLIEDAKKNQTDGTGDYWSDPMVSAARQVVGEFTVTNAVFEDLQGRFNINNLVEDPRITVSQNNYRGFIRLLDIVGLPPTLADAAYDWIDIEPRQNGNYGAEDAAYSRLEKPYLTPNLDMASASEMNRLNGVNLAGDKQHRKHREKILNMLYTRGQRVLVALPWGTKINVNTPDSPDIYHLLVAGISVDNAQDLYNMTQNLAQGAAPPFADTDAFWNHSQAIPQVDVAKRVEISVKSEYFLFKAEAISGDLVVYSSTIFYRNGITVKVVHRSYGSLGEI